MSFAESGAENAGLLSAAGSIEAAGTSGSNEQFECITRFLGQSRGFFLLEPVASLLVTATLWTEVSGRQAGVWLILVWVATILRGLLSWHIDRANPSAGRLQEWSLATSAAAGLTGAIWASGLLFMWPPESGALAVLLTALIIAVIGIETAAVARYQPAAVIYLVMTIPAGLMSVTLNRHVEPLLAVSVAAVLAVSMALLAGYVKRLHAAQAQLRLELDSAYEAGAAAHRAKSEFIANMSHELRTPLNAINGFSEIIRNQAYGRIGNEKYLNYAKDIHDSGTRLLEVVNDILEMSKLETGDMSLAEEELDIDSMVQTAFNMIRDSAEKAGVTVSFKESPDRPKKMVGDRRLLKQILVNLLSNAVKFTSLGGEVTVEVKYSASRDFLLIVRDNGIGMAADEIPLALAPFGQADTSLSRRFEGAGLGLSLVRELVLLHGGDFRLESEPSVGTTAVVTFPASCIRS